MYMYQLRSISSVPEEDGISETDIGRAKYKSKKIKTLRENFSVVVDYF